jgi:hypothetical protein
MLPGNRLDLKDDGSEMHLLVLVPFGWLTPYTAVRTGLGLIALALLAWTIWGRATSQRDFLPLAAVLSALWWTLAGGGDLE